MQLSQQAGHPTWDELQDTTRFIRFTQYLRPNGHKEVVFAPMPEGYSDKVAAILASNSAFEAEVLGTGIVSLTVTDHTRDFAIELCPNGPEVQEALKRLIDGAYKFITAPKAPEEE